MKVRIDLKILMYIVITLPFMSSPLCDQYLVLDVLFKVGKLIAVLLLGYLIHKYKYRPSRTFILIVILNVYLIINTIVNKGDLNRCIYTVIPIIIVACIYDLGISKDTARFILAQFKCFSFLVYVNLASELLFPNGMYIAAVTNYSQNWVLGYYNNHSVYYIMTITVAMLYSLFFNDRLKVVCLFVAIGLSAALVFSGGVIVGLTIVYFAIILFLLGVNVGRYYAYWSVHFFFYIFIILPSNLIWKKIVTYTQLWLGKGASFVSRYNLWKRELSLFAMKPWFGYGVESQQARLKEYGWALHTHNIVMEMLHQGGCIYVALFIVIIIITGRKLYVFGSKRIRCVISIGILGWVIITLVEPFITPFLVALFIIAENTEYLNVLDGNLKECDHSSC